MGGLSEQLHFSGATIDELLSAADGPLPGTLHDAGLVERRLAAWRRAAAAGDETLFARRLDRDGWTLDAVRGRLAARGDTPAAPSPSWIEDAPWIREALESPAVAARPASEPAETPVAFEDVLLPLVRQAETRLWQGLDATASANFDDSARADLAHMLLRNLSELCTPALYEAFAKVRNATGTGCYGTFAAGMKTGALRRLFEERPVLLRLIATLTRQWVETSRELALRLAADLPAIRRELLPPGGGPVIAIEGDLADPHNGGRSVQIMSFAGGARLVYKPKDLRLDAAWYRLIEKLNGADAPIALQAVRVLARDGYGWAEFIAHRACADAAACRSFYRRAGSLLTLFHLFATTDMHQENLIAAGEYPVPVDLETILQPSAEEYRTGDAEGEAFDAAMEIVANSVMTVGLLPAYGRSVDNNLFAMGGMTADWGARTVITWTGINTDAMRPAKTKLPAETNTNLPHVGGRYAKFADHIEDFIAGFADYASFLSRYAGAPNILFDGFAGLPVRRVIRPTRFYYMLLRRLKDHRTMDDGALWSAQADFMARLAEWDKESDPLWPLQRAERAALLTLNVPHFTSPTDGDAIADATGATVHTVATPGLARARTRLRNLDENEIAWQIEVIRANTSSIAAASASSSRPGPLRDATQAGAVAALPGHDTLIAEADRIASEIARYAIRRGPGAAWIGLDWLGDSEVSQLVCLGPDLYNGSTGIAVFLAAHAAVTGNAATADLALAAIARLSQSLKRRSAPRTARLLGIGGASGLGSIVYGLAVIAQTLRSTDILADAEAAARLFSDELIAADKQLDVMGGSAGAILGLLRLYRDRGSAEALARATKCGEHLMAQSRVGTPGRRTWVGLGAGAQGLNGMSHGAAGFAYALASLAAATGRDDFAAAASECIAFEDASYEPERRNWPDLRGATPAWPCQWCHGAPGIGLARLGIQRRGGNYAKAKAAVVTTDIGNAAAGVERGPPGDLDTLCCGSLGRIEFLCEAASVLERSELRQRAAERLAAVLQRAEMNGDYRWNGGKRKFNLGLFRGLAGVGYTLLRQAAPPGGDALLPNVLIWE